MTTSDDCFRAALATLVQVPKDEVPDLHLDERQFSGESVDTISRASWDTVISWLGSRGLAMTLHEKPPVHRWRWLGIVRPPVETAEPFSDHALIFRRGQLLHDPYVVSAYERSLGYTPVTWTLADVTMAYTIDKKET